MSGLETNNKAENCQAKCENQDTQKVDQEVKESNAENADYWRFRYEKLSTDYNHLQKINQNLEEKLLNIADTFEKKREELVANIEHEKSTLMADVNKLSTKLVDARIKLHDYEEKELIHASECDSPCHRNCPDQASSINSKTNGHTEQQLDPNLI